MTFKFDLPKLSTIIYETTEHELTESYNDISIVIDTANVALLPSETGKTTVVCREHANMKHSVTIKDGTLLIEALDKRKWYNHISSVFEAPKITVYLPAGAYGVLSVKENTGDIVIPENFSFKTIDLSTNTGHVENSASASECIKIATNTGNIDVKDISTGNLELSVSTGKLTASSVSCDGDATIKVTTGKTSLSNITCKNMSSSGSTGNILLTDVHVKKTMLIERTTGDVTFENSDAASISVKTSTGDVRGTFRSGKTFYTATLTGRVNVPQTNGGACEIATTTGDIKIELTTN